MSSTEPPSRAALRIARRVCVKAGTSVVANDDGSPSLTRLGAICEQIAELHKKGVEVIFVSSGSVGMGKRLLRKQRQLYMTFKDMQDDTGNGSNSNMLQLLEQPQTSRLPGERATRVSSFVNLLETNERPHTLQQKKRYYDSACAAAGQFEMMNLYSNLFAQCDVSASQILVTQADFADETRRNNLRYALERLLGLGVVPIINENDAVSANLGYTADDVFSDNDSLAALCARSFEAEVLLLLTDVEGVFDRPPSEPGAKRLEFYQPEQSEVAIGEKSAQGESVCIICSCIVCILCLSLFLKIDLPYPSSFSPCQNLLLLTNNRPWWNGVQDYRRSVGRTTRIGLQCLCRCFGSRSQFDSGRFGQQTQIQL